MHQLTVRGFDPELERRLHDLAAREGISLSQAALRLMRRGAGLQRPERSPRIGDALDAFIGVWSAEEAESIGAEIEAMFEQVDEEQWT
jgi:hypothetical protein